MQTQPSPTTASGREASFVARVIRRCGEDKGLAARLRRADNPATEYQSWEFLADCGISLDHESERLPFATVAAYIAKAKLDENGKQGLGRAIAACFDEGNQSDQAKARLRRLLACDEPIELCRILRPQLALIDSRGQRLDCARLLKQLRQFAIAAHTGDDRWLQNIKAQWAQEFYGHKVEIESQAEAGEGA